MKLKLTAAQRAIFKEIGKVGGLSGNREKKSASAKARWARERQEKEQHQSNK